MRNRATTNQKYAINSQKTEESASIKLKEEFQATKRKAEKKKEKGTKMKQRINWETRFEMTINIYIYISESESVSHLVVSNSCDTMDYIVHQVPLSVEFSRQEYWIGLLP